MIKDSSIRSYPHLIIALSLGEEVRFSLDSGWLGPKFDLNAVEKNMYCPFQESNYDYVVAKPVA
jgi:hypothetical protein